MATCKKEVSADGISVIRLQNSCLSVSVLPQLGGKIYEIVDLRSGRDWLWKNPHIPLRRPQPDMLYDRELDSGGWDEILFSVKPCTVDLPNGQQMSAGDHGVLVGIPWRLVHASAESSGEAVCELHADGQSPSFLLRRRISIDAEQPKIVIEYTLNNTGDIQWPWLWCAHPLIAVEYGMHIGLQEGQAIYLNPASAADADRVNGGQFWPMLRSPDGRSTNLAVIFKEPTNPESFSTKVFVRFRNKVCVSTPEDVESFSIEYDERDLPWLGLWINKKAWSGCGSEPYLNLGVEPATAPHDTLAEAVSLGCADYLQPGESRSWTLGVYLKPTELTHG